MSFPKNILTLSIFGCCVCICICRRNMSGRQRWTPSALRHIRFEQTTRTLQLADTVVDQKQLGARAVTIGEAWSGETVNSPIGLARVLGFDL